MSAIRPLPDFAISLAFFTRLPLPHFTITDRKLGEAIWAAPVAGAVIALVVWLAAMAADAIGVPLLPAAALAIAVSLLVTGCLHEDGLADVADGFGGGKTVESKLEIMHDSRLGAYGAAALVVSILIRWSCIASLLQNDALLPGLIAAHAGSRAIFAKLIRETPLASQSGLASTVGDISDQSAWISLGLGVLALALLGFFGAFTTILVVVVLVLAFRQLCMRQISGVTGDTLGAAQQVAEIAILIAAASIAS